MTKRTTTAPKEAPMTAYAAETDELDAFAEAWSAAEYDTTRDDADRDDAAQARARGAFAEAWSAARKAAQARDLLPDEVDRLAYDAAFAAAAAAY